MLRMTGELIAGFRFSTEWEDGSGFWEEKAAGGEDFFNLPVDVFKCAVVAEGYIRHLGGFRDMEDFFLAAVVGEELLVGGGVALFRPFSHALETDLGVGNIDIKQEEVLTEGIPEDSDVLRRPYAGDADRLQPFFLNLRRHQPDESPPPLLPEILLRDLLEVGAGRLDAFCRGKTAHHIPGGEEGNAVAAAEVFDDLILPGTVLTDDTYNDGGHRLDKGLGYVFFLFFE